MKYRLVKTFLKKTRLSSSRNSQIKVKDGVTVSEHTDKNNDLYPSTSDKEILADPSRYCLSLNEGFQKVFYTLSQGLDYFETESLNEEFQEMLNSLSLGLYSFEAECLNEGFQEMLNR